VRRATRRPEHHEAFATQSPHAHPHHIQRRWPGPEKHQRQDHGASPEQISKPSERRARQARNLEIETARHIHCVAQHQLHTPCRGGRRKIRKTPHVKPVESLDPFPDPNPFASGNAIGVNIGNPNGSHLGRRLVHFHPECGNKPLPCSSYD
jgi:hypothetical protein